MKKIISVVLIFITVFVSIPFSIAETNPSALSDTTGYYVTELNEVFPDGDSGTRGYRYFVKTLSYYDSNDQKQWDMKLAGAFSFDETSVTCTSASVTYTIYNSNWHFQSKNAWPSGNTANGTLTMAKKFLGITVQTVTKSLTITCDANGNIS